jgi:uncharacterized OB-fold protein
MATGNLTLCRCQDCRLWVHPPLERCRRCGGPTAFEAISGTGTVYSYTVVHRRSVPGYATPYTVVLVDLDEAPGLRLSGIVKGDAGDGLIGSRVRAQFSDMSPDEVNVPYFVVMDPTRTRTER